MINIKNIGEINKYIYKIMQISLPKPIKLLKFPTFLSIITHIPEDHQWVFERECFVF